MRKILFVFAAFFLVQSNAQNNYQFTEVKTFENIKELLSADEIRGFTFDPVRNKAVVELRFTVPSCKKYKTIYVERGDTAKGFNSILTLDMENDKTVSESFTKIDKYPMPYAERTHYRVKCISQDGTIRYYPYIKELIDQDLLDRDQQRAMQEKTLKEKQDKEAKMWKDWEANKGNKSVDTTKYSAPKPEIVYDYYTQSEMDRKADSKKAVADSKNEKLSKLDRIKIVEEELKAKADELKKLLEGIASED